jgi:hypothetical protein
MKLAFLGKPNDGVRLSGELPPIGDCWSHGVHILVGGWGLKQTLPPLLGQLVGPSFVSLAIGNGRRGALGVLIRSDLG